MLHLWAPGNTLPSFQRARNDDVDILEMDLRASSDGVVFVFHDPALDGQTDCAGSIEESAARRIAEDCRYDWTHDRIPTFREVLDWAAKRSGPRGHLVLDAELKSDAAVAPAVALVKELDAYGWVYFQVESLRSRYALVRSIDPAVGLLFSPRNDADVTWALGLGDPNLLVLEVHEDNGTKRSIERIHAAGKFVSENSYYRGSELWSARCDEVFADGIDIAISNRTGGCARQRDRAD